MTRAFFFLAFVLLISIAALHSAPPSNGLPIKAVMAPLMYDSGTGTLSCPSCVTVDATGSIAIQGGITTGKGGARPGQLTLLDSAGKPWFFCASTSGIFPTQGASTNCAP